MSQYQQLDKLLSDAPDAQDTLDAQERSHLSGCLVICHVALETLKVAPDTSGPVRTELASVQRVSDSTDCDYLCPDFIGLHPDLTDHGNKF